MCSTRNRFGVLNLCLPSVRWYKGIAEAELVCIYHPCTVLDLYRSVLRSYFSSILGCVSFYACLLRLITHSRRAAESFTCVYTHIWPFVCRTSLKSNAFETITALLKEHFQRNSDTAGLFCAAIYCSGVKTLHG